MMKLLVALFVVLALSEALPSKSNIKSELNEEWELFKSKFNKKYESQLHEVSRRLIWEENVKSIQKHNIAADMDKVSYTIGVNEFTDLTHEEFKRMYLGMKQHRQNVTAPIRFRAPLNMVNYPSKVDWRTKGYVTPVKNQGQCGSCWAFSTTGSMEGQYFRKTGQLLSFSEQQLVDCSGKFGNDGCGGGLMDNAFKYIEKFGIERESDYTYHAQDNNCKYAKNKVAAKCRSFVDIEHGSETDLMKAVATVGPVSVGIDASHPSFQMYSGGVYDEPECSSTSLDHGVLVVGYGTYNGRDYWLVKNSWGPSWGLNGYLMMSKDKNNQCGIATSASYPVV